MLSNLPFDQQIMQKNTKVEVYFPCTTTYRKVVNAHINCTLCSKLHNCKVYRKKIALFIAEKSIRVNHLT